MSSAAASAARLAASSPPAQRMRAYTSGTGIQVHSSRHFLVMATAASTQLRGTPPTHACLQAAQTTTPYAYGRHRRPSQMTKVRAGGGTRETMVPYESLLLSMYVCIWRVLSSPLPPHRISHPILSHLIQFMHIDMGCITVFTTTGRTNAKLYYTMTADI
jgi:hypothetical protein